MISVENYTPPNKSLLNRILRHLVATPGIGSEQTYDRLLEEIRRIKNGDEEALLSIKKRAERLLHSRDEHGLLESIYEAIANRGLHPNSDFAREHKTIEIR